MRLNVLKIEEVKKFKNAGSKVFMSGEMEEEISDKLSERESGLLIKKLKSIHCGQNYKDGRHGSPIDVML